MPAEGENMRYCRELCGIVRRTGYASVGVVLVFVLVSATPIFGQTPSFAASAAGQAYGGGDTSTTTGVKPQYPGIGPSEGKAEIEMGAYKVRLFGTLLLNMSG